MHIRVAALLLDQVEEVVVDISRRDNSLGTRLINVFDRLSDRVADGQPDGINEPLACELEELEEQQLEPSQASIVLRANVDANNAAHRGAIGLARP